MKAHLLKLALNNPSNPNFWLRLVVTRAIQRSEDLNVVHQLVKAILSGRDPELIDIDDSISFEPCDAQFPLGEDLRLISLSLILKKAYNKTYRSVDLMEHFEPEKDFVDFKKDHEMESLRLKPEAYVLYLFNLSLNGNEFQDLIAAAQDWAHLESNQPSLTEVGLVNGGKIHRLKLTEWKIKVLQSEGIAVNPVN